MGPFPSLCPGSCGQLGCLGAQVCKRSCVCRSTCVRAIAGVCARPLQASHHRLPQLPSGRVQRCVFPACLLLPRPNHRVCTAGRLARSTQSTEVLAPGTQPNSPRLTFFCSRASLSTRQERSRAGAESSPARAGRQGWPPPPRRPGGFFHDCIRPRAAFVPAVPGGGPPLPRAPGFFQGSTGAWQSRLPAPGLQSPGSGNAPSRTPRSPAGSRALSRLPLGPSRPCRQGLRPLSPTFVRKVDGLPSQAPPRFVRLSWFSESLPGCTLLGGGQASAVCRAGARPPLPPDCGRGLAFLARGRESSPGGSRPDGPHHEGEPRRAYTTWQSKGITGGAPRRWQIPGGNVPARTGKWARARAVSARALGLLCSQNPFLACRKERDRQARKGRWGDAGSGECVRHRGQARNPRPPLGQIPMYAFGTVCPRPGSCRCRAALSLCVSQPLAELSS